MFGLTLPQLFAGHSCVPPLWRHCFLFLAREESLETVGILRVPGNAEACEDYKQAYDRGEAPDFFDEDGEACVTCHDVVALLKQYIRELPELIVPTSIDTEMHGIIERKGETMRDDFIRALQQLPYPNFLFLKLLSKLLRCIFLNSEVNKMTTGNILACIVPTMKCSPHILHYTVSQFVKLFGEEDIEQMLDKADEVIFKQNEKARKKQEARAAQQEMARIEQQREEDHYRLQNKKEELQRIKAEQEKAEQALRQQAQLKKERQEQELKRLNKEKEKQQQQQQQERERIERERRDKEEQQRRERQEKQRLEQERLELERLEQERLEREEAEREQELLELQRRELERELREQDRLDRERERNRQDDEMLAALDCLGVDEESAMARQPAGKQPPSLKNITNPFAVEMDELDMLLLEADNKSDPDSDDLLADDDYGYFYGSKDTPTGGDIPEDIDINEDELAALLLETQKTLRNLQEKARTSVQQQRESKQQSDFRMKRQTYMMVKEDGDLLGNDGGFTVDFEGFGDLDLHGLDDAGFEIGAGGELDEYELEKARLVGDPDDQAHHQLLLRESRIRHLDGFDLLHALEEGMDPESRQAVERAPTRLAGKRKDTKGSNPRSRPEDSRYADAPVQVVRGVVSLQSLIRRKLTVSTLLKQMPDYSRWRKKAFMFNELIKDSKVYAVTLGFMARMQQTYFAGLSKSNQALMATILSLLQSVNSLAGLQETLVKSLEDRKKEFYRKQGRVGDIYNKLLSFFKFYLDYMSRWELASKTLYQSENTIKLVPEIVKILDQVRQDYFNLTKLRCDLDDLLIIPCHYLPKCIHLLNDFLTVTPSTQPDYQDIKTAIAKVTEIAQTKTQAMRDNNNIIASRLANAPSANFLNEITRKYVHQGAVLLCIDPSNTEALKESESMKGLTFTHFLNVYLFLFSDVLITTKEEVSSKEKLGMARVVLQRKGNYQYAIDDLINNAHLKFQYRNQKRLLGADLFDYNDKPKSDFYVLGFREYNSELIDLLIFQNEATKKTWIAKLNNIIWKELEIKRTRYLKEIIDENDKRGEENQFIGVTRCSGYLDVKIERNGAWKKTKFAILDDSKMCIFNSEQDFLVNEPPLMNVFVLDITCVAAEEEIGEMYFKISKNSAETGPVNYYFAPQNRFRRYMWINSVRAVILDKVVQMQDKYTVPTTLSRDSGHAKRLERRLPSQADLLAKKSSQSPLNALPSVSIQSTGRPDRTESSGQDETRVQRSNSSSNGPGGRRQSHHAVQRIQRMKSEIDQLNSQLAQGESSREGVRGQPQQAYQPQTANNNNSKQPQALSPNSNNYNSNSSSLTRKSRSNSTGTQFGSEFDSNPPTNSTSPGRQPVSAGTGRRAELVREKSGSDRAAMVSSGDGTVSPARAMLSRERSRGGERGDASQGEAVRQVKRAELTREWSGGGAGGDTLGRQARRPELTREASNGGGDGRLARRAELTREWSGNGTGQGRAELSREKSSGASTGSALDPNAPQQPLRRKSKSFNSFDQNPRNADNNKPGGSKPLPKLPPKAPTRINITNNT